MTAPFKIGIDLGGTKTLGAIFDQQDREITRRQHPTPTHDYDGTLEIIAEIVSNLEQQTRLGATIGVGIPGSISPATGRVQNANSTWLNDKDFKNDLQNKLGRPVRIANDANCFAISEAIDGAGQEARSLFGVILGTGCGGGFVINGKPLEGAHGIAGEWGHTPLPWPTPEEHDGLACWCGKTNCLETWISGPALMADHKRHTRQDLIVEDIATLARNGDKHAQASLQRHANRLARGLAVIINILDPDVIVLGGGLSNLKNLYYDLPKLLPPLVFSNNFSTKIQPPKHGPASGVRGAAWLWNQ